MVCMGRGLRAVHAYSSFGRIYVEYRYARAEELRELRRRRMFFKEVNDLLESHWCALSGASRAGK